MEQNSEPFPWESDGDLPWLESESLPWEAEDELVVLPESESWEEEEEVEEEGSPGWPEECAGPEYWLYKDMLD